jgi:D-apiose dehydrogenase
MRGTAMSPLRFAILGTGFWAQYQLSGWREIAGAECVAVYNRTRGKAEALAKQFGIASVYDEAETMIERERLDFVDVITDVGTHRRFVELAAAHQLPVICQKPMAETLEDGQAMVSVCRAAGVPFLVHENWRWQRPLREVKRVLDSGVIGRVFRGRIDYCNSFPVFENQPFLKELNQFILTDVGSHILDAARFLFGEASQLYCRTHRVHEDIQGEDVASVMMTMGGNVTVTVQMSYASRLEQDRFPETFLLIEGSKGSIELGPDYWVRVTTADGTVLRRVAPPHYTWADARYALVHSSIVPCHANLVGALRGEGEAETTGEDNLKTVELVFKAYESSAAGKVLELG